MTLTRIDNTGNGVIAIGRFEVAGHELCGNVQRFGGRYHARASGVRWGLRGARPWWSLDVPAFDSAEAAIAAVEAWLADRAEKLTAAQKDGAA